MSELRLVALQLPGIRITQQQLEHGTDHLSERSLLSRALEVDWIS